MNMFGVFDETHKLIETDQVIDVHRVCRTAWGARRAAERMNSLRMNIGGHHMIRYEVEKRGRFRYEVIVFQNMLVHR